MSYNADEKVSDILKTKRAGIKQAPLPKGAPGWDEVQRLSWSDIEERAKLGLTGYRMLKKLLTKKEYER